MAAHTNVRELTAAYALCPPEGTISPQSLTSNTSHSFPVILPPENKSDAGEYYSALRKSIVAAREKLGEELTAWRDAVGNTELGKEKAVKVAQMEDEEEEEEEEA
ncbi:hypothetical protein HYDPIDRAFT_109602, partial [Hydnomerulius pinastri MD-312]